jgi:hypothetical protein
MKKLLLSLFIIIPALVSAQTTPFVITFGFDSVKTTSGRVDPTPLPVVTGVTIDSVRAINLSANTSGGGRFSFSTWPLGATNGVNTYATMTGAVDTAKYYEFEFTTQSGYMMEFDSISFRFQRSGTGVRTYVVRGSADNFTTNLAAAVVPPSVKIDIMPNNIFFYNVDSTVVVNGNTVYPGAAYDSISGTTKFRFYGFNAEGNAGTFSIDNVTFYGSTTFVTGIQTVGSLNTRVFPNPVSTGSLTIMTTAGEKLFELFDVTGNKIASFTSYELSTELPVSNLAKGNYMIRITSSEGMNITKFCKN